jgi:hypothetical protein
MSQSSESPASSVDLCPAWCADCDREGGPPGSVLHLGVEHLVDGYGECGQLIGVSVRAVFFDLPDECRQASTPDLTRPYIEVRIPDAIGPTISLTPAQARQFAAALTAAVEVMGTTEPRR